MTASYELSLASNGQYRFVLKDATGTGLLSSELYKSKASALNGIASVQTNSAHEQRFERLVAKNGKSYFNLKAANHQVIGTSHFYASETECEDAIAAVKQYGPAVTIQDLTL